VECRRSGNSRGLPCHAVCHANGLPRGLSAESDGARDPGDVMKRGLKSAASPSGSRQRLTTAYVWAVQADASRLPLGREAELSTWRPHPGFEPGFSLERAAVL
jgi:hypothetical protein